MIAFINSYLFVFIFFIIFLIFLFLSFLIKNKILKKISILFSSFFLSIFLAELVLSIVNDKIYKYDYSENIFQLEDNGFIEQTHKGIKDNQVIFDVEYKKYKNGFRYTKCNEESLNTYVFMGCSFMFGWGLNDDETLPYYFSQITNFKNNIINCAYIGRSSNTALNILNSNILDKFKTEKSDIKVFVYNIMLHSAMRNFQFIGNIDWVYKDGNYMEPKQPYGNILKYFSKSYIFYYVFLDFFNKFNQSFYDDYLIQSLYKMKDIIEHKYNSHFLILVYGDIYNELNDKFDVIYIKNFKTISDKDGHPSSQANKTTANIIFNHLKEKNII